MYSSRNKSSERESPTFPASTIARIENDRTLYKIQSSKIYMPQLQNMIMNSFAQSKFVKGSLLHSFNIETRQMTRQMEEGGAHLWNCWSSWPLLLTSDVSTSTKGFTTCTFDDNNASFFVIFPFLKEKKETQKNHSQNYFYTFMHKNWCLNKANCWSKDFTNVSLSQQECFSLE